MAIALGCAVIALEVASEVSSRSTLFRRRMELMRSRILELHDAAADAQRQLATMRSERLARANVNRVLSAADVTLLRLLPAAASGAHGLVAISRQAGGAIIEIAGLQTAAGRICVMWWLRAQEPPAKAAEINPDFDGRLSLALPMPPRGARITGVIITLEPGPPVGQPKGGILLKGLLPRPQGLS